jgi:hypothetical protein
VFAGVWGSTDNEQGWHDVKVISRQVHFDMRIGENVKMLGAYGINTESVVELKVIIKKIVKRSA